MTTAGAPRVLSIAGSDPSGGAGIQADLETFAAFGVDGCTAITALTAQNEHRVAGVFAVPPEFLALQIATVFEERPVDAVKVGMLANAANVRVVVDALRGAALDHVVIDPVLRASSGAALIDDAGVALLRDELLPLATVITPNALEAGVLLGSRAPSTRRDMRDAARALLALGPAWVLVTGGHTGADDTECVDVLAGDGDMIELCTPRVPGPGIHGSGCRLSSAVAALLALGMSVPEASRRAQEYVAHAIATAPEREPAEVI